MTSYAAWGALVVVLVAAVMVSGCTTSLPFASAPSSKSRDLSGSYDAAFVEKTGRPLPRLYKRRRTCIQASM
ncbi:MAG: hypothetical protein ACXVIK_04085 [Halobacteriota archaeon]